MARDHDVGREVRARAAKRVAWCQAALQASVDDLSGVESEALVVPLATATVAMGELHELLKGEESSTELSRAAWSR
jgi:hypothetical protein